MKQNIIKNNSKIINPQFIYSNSKKYKNNKISKISKINNYIIINNF